MGVHVVDLEAHEWQRVPDSWPGKSATGDPVRFKLFELGAPVMPMGQLIEYEAGYVEPPHSHDESEVYVVLSGDLTVGDERVGEGMLVYIPGGTVYSPSTDGGCRFLRLGFDEAGAGA